MQLNSGRHAHVEHPRSSRAWKTKHFNEMPGVDVYFARNKNIAKNPRVNFLDEFLLDAVHKQGCRGILPAAAYGLISA